MAVIKWYKKYTETLNETLKRFRLENPEFNNKKITYAGRLDPMAEGLIILLTGEDVHRKEDFLGLDKVYEVEFIFGLDTDTYDILGLLTDSSINLTSVGEDVLEKVLEKKICVFEQEYPPYSSKTINGKPFFVWAREGKIKDIIIPTRNVEIRNIEYLGKKQVSRELFKNELIKNISLVVGDFRQSKILKKWTRFFSICENNEKVIIYTIRVHASSGTYMRSLIKDIGVLIGIPAISLKIKRVSIGKYN